MHPVNIRRLEVNDFALALAEYLSNDDIALGQVKLYYNNILINIQGCIREESYSTNHNIKIRFGEKMNEINYETLCDISCDIFKYTNKRLPDKIHKRIVFGKMNDSVREYIQLTP